MLRKILLKIHLVNNRPCNQPYNLFIYHYMFERGQDEITVFCLHLITTLLQQVELLYKD